MVSAFSFAEKKRRSAEQFNNESGGQTTETTPTSVTAAITSFARTLSPEALVVVPVVPDTGYGLHGWCSDGVLEKIDHDGGSIVFGWTIWEWPKIMLTAEFHALWQDPSGKLCDITPKPQGEKTIVFVPDRQYPPDFDFDKRPVNRRTRLYPDQDLAPLVAAKLTSMSNSQHTYENGRAVKAGCTLNEWIAKKIPRDPLPEKIDQFIEVCGAFDVKFDSLGPAGDIVADRELHGLLVSKVTRLNELRKILPK